MRAINITTKKELARHVIMANTLLRRMKGLLGKKKLEEGEALWIRPCKSVHTIGMRFSIDVVFLDRSNVVVKVKKNLLPNRVTGLYLSAASVLELAADTLAAIDIRVGDRIEIA